MFKICTTCGLSKDRSMFCLNNGYKDSLNGRCKDCMREYYKDYRSQKHVKEARKKYNKEYKQRSDVKIRLGKYYKTPIQKIAKAARQEVFIAIKNGTLIKGGCEVCGTDQNVQGHHESYEKSERLNVNWLCPKHHGIRHAEINGRA